MPEYSAVLPRLISTTGRAGRRRWIHGPALEDQRMAVAAAGQQQEPGGTHGADR